MLLTMSGNVVKWKRSRCASFYLFMYFYFGAPVNTTPTLRIVKDFHSLSSIPCPYCGIVLSLAVTSFRLFIKPVKTLWVWIPFDQMGACVRQQDPESICSSLMLHNVAYSNSYHCKCRFHFHFLLSSVFSFFSFVVIVEIDLLIPVMFHHFNLE